MVIKCYEKFPRVKDGFLMILVEVGGFLPKFCWGAANKAFHMVLGHVLLSFEIKGRCTRWNVQKVEVVKWAGSFPDSGLLMVDDPPSSSKSMAPTSRTWSQDVPSPACSPANFWSHGWEGCLRFYDVRGCLFCVRTQQAEHSGFDCQPPKRIVARPEPPSFPRQILAMAQTVFQMGWSKYYIGDIADIAVWL